MDNFDKEEGESACYHAWRRSEAHMLPMTKEGIQRAEERYKQFQKGWDYAIKSCMLTLEKEHSKNKKTHSFFNIAKGFIGKLRLTKGV
jgi:hypothetical protein